MRVLAFIALLIVFLGFSTPMFAEKWIGYDVDPEFNDVYYVDIDSIKYDSSDGYTYFRVDIPDYWTGDYYTYNEAMSCGNRTHYYKADDGTWKKYTKVDNKLYNFVCK